MTRKILLACLLVLNLGAPAPPQQPQPQDRQGVRPPITQQPAQQDDDDVVRITTNLVQLDAVVLDKDGRHVTDLRPEDFEIVEDGRKRPITNFSYVDTSPARTTSSPVVAADASRGKAKRSSKSRHHPSHRPSCQRARRGASSCSHSTTGTSRSRRCGSHKKPPGSSLKSSCSRAT